MTVYDHAGQYGPEIFEDANRKLLRSKEVYVYLPGTGTLATLYTDRTKATPAANPFLIDSRGNGTFFANPAVYEISYAGTRYSVTVPLDFDDMGAGVPGPPGSVDSVDGMTGTVVLSSTYVPFPTLALDPGTLITGDIDRDDDGAAIGGDVLWPDGTPGTFVGTPSADTPGAIDSYVITYGDPATVTYTQPTMTRDVDGAVTNRPALVVT